MKQLIFFRHGKSDWEAGFDKDHGRPVSTRGRKAAQLMGRFLAVVDEVPDKVLSSSAVRARTTAELAMQAGGWDCPLELCDDLYESTPQAILARVRQQPDELEVVLVAGHEPSWSATVGGLVGGGELRFPTAAMARVDLDVEHWRDVDWGRGLLIWHLTPRLLGRFQAAVGAG